MDSLKPLIIPLRQVTKSDENLIGGKAYKLSQLTQSGFQIPDGFCITIFAYQQFVNYNRLDEKIGFELGRKSFDQMRWEEMWDSALRIRSAFTRAVFPKNIEEGLHNAFDDLGARKTLVIRSSAPKEDSAKASFAGLHESYIGIKGEKELLDAVPLVWASLWSDAALLYQQELGLDPLHSSMAVLVQELIEEDVSGVAFGIDPRDPGADRSIIEAVPGLCRDLVDGVIDPDRWIIKRSSGEVIEMKPGKEESERLQQPLMDVEDLNRLYKTLQGIESLFGWYPDVEWTGKAERFTLLQARPITTDVKPSDDKSFYLGLRPGESKLKALAKKVADDLIPKLEAEGERFAKEDLSVLDDQQLADSIEQRHAALESWKKIYWDEFIPFAHGVRYLGTYYNDAVQPEDPYEFVGLLKGQQMISTQRNDKLISLANLLKADYKLGQRLKTLCKDITLSEKEWKSIKKQAANFLHGEEFIRNFDEFMETYMDVSYGEERVLNKPVPVLKIIIELSNSQNSSEFKNQNKVDDLETKLFMAVGSEKKVEAEEVLHIGRLSWRLRDDDNLLLGRVESQLIRALEEGGDRLKRSGRLQANVVIPEKSTERILSALRDETKGKITLSESEAKPKESLPKDTHTKPRQLTGQPASPGMVSGKVRVIRKDSDIGDFKSGEILVCDAIQPNMTHLVPLARAIIERRGGMLIHGAIIAREMNIPCVNGVSDAANLLENGELVTVDGNLGIVTVGVAEFDLEMGL